MQSARPIQTSVAIEEVTQLKERGLLQRIIANQAFWVTLTVALICAATAWQEPETFPTRDNFFNITRNFAPIGIMAMGMIAVILTRGIDLSVGSMMALVGISAARLLEAGFPWWAATGAGLLVGLLGRRGLVLRELGPSVGTARVGGTLAASGAGCHGNAETDSACGHPFPMATRLPRPKR